MKAGMGNGESNYQREMTGRKNCSKEKTTSDTKIRLCWFDAEYNGGEEGRSVLLRNTVAATTSGILIFTWNIENGVSDGATFQWYTVQEWWHGVNIDAGLWSMTLKVTYIWHQVSKNVKEWMTVINTLCFYSCDGQ